MARQDGDERPRFRHFGVNAPIPHGLLRKKYHNGHAICVAFVVTLNYHFCYLT